ncbi:hypothetical protein CRE_21599 [Caenorhabditis remanei]|uniref:DUF7809 domain-containing protein n=1 Tax=Caenorhabditis remanei TaxID=31234 RepID=E3NLZ5_CAERE|nr:hypothetical protein CRE_21599 [Caenorhabditis remanei]
MNRKHDNLISSESFEAVFSRYILQQHKKHTCFAREDYVRMMGEYWDEKQEIDFIQKILDDSNGQLKMYGSAQEIYQNLVLYRTFSQSHWFFKDHVFDGYYIEPDVNLSLKNEYVIHKTNIFVMLQTIIARDFPKWESTILRFILSTFLKSEEILAAHVEFVKFNETDFLNMRAEINRLLAVDHRKEEFKKLEEKMSKISYSEYRKMFESLPGIEWKQAHLVRLDIIVKSLYDQKPKNAETMSFLYHTTKATIDCFKMFMNSKPEWFLPNSENKNPLYAVRLFQDGNRRFVMKAEFFRVLNSLPSTKEPIVYKDKPDRLDTMMYEDLVLNYRARIPEIEVGLTDDWKFL